MHIKVEIKNDVAIATLPESLRHITPESIESAENELVNLIEDPNINKMVIDLNKMEYGGTPALALLVHIYLKAKKRNKKLRFCDFHPFAEEVLQKTHLNNLFEIYKCREDALKGFISS